ncbi:unnamed protein product [Porites lobata]|uniref:DUF8077 domain-containing protein n=1 Tax=Porites lobata TaxID=104759 RepID=A0ABN8RV66_9CNID|nr:unnamed protein product [Porites lobata]
MRESVMLKVKNMDLKKWGQNMEYSFKKKVAAAATEYCARAQVQCYPNQSRQKRSAKNVTFTADMVHILPGYPKQSHDSPGVVLLAFYLSLPQGTSESSVVSGSILHDIVMDHKENIQTSFGGEISSVDPFPSATEVLKNEESDEGNGGKSKPTNVIIGASVGGGLLLIIIAAVLIGCKKSDRFSKCVANQEDLEETPLTLMLEMEDIGEDVSSSPAKIQHETNRAVNPIHDKPASRLYHSLPGEPSGVALAKKTGSEMNPSKSGLI